MQPPSRASWRSGLPWRVGRGHLHGKLGRDVSRRVYTRTEELRKNGGEYDLPKSTMGLIVDTEKKTVQVLVPGHWWRPQPERKLRCLRLKYTGDQSEDPP